MKIFISLFTALFAVSAAAQPGHEPRQSLATSEPAYYLEALQNNVGDYMLDITIEDPTHPTVLQFYRNFKLEPIMGTTGQMVGQRRVFVVVGNIHTGTVMLVSGSIGQRMATISYHNSVSSSSWPYWVHRPIDIRLHGIGADAFGQETLQFGIPSADMEALIGVWRGDASNHAAREFTRVAAGQIHELLNSAIAAAPRNTQLTQLNRVANFVHDERTNRFFLRTTPVIDPGPTGLLSRSRGQFTGGSPLSISSARGEDATVEPLIDNQVTQDQAILEWRGLSQEQRVTIAGKLDLISKINRADRGLYVCNIGDLEFLILYADRRDGEAHSLFEELVGEKREEAFGYILNLRDKSFSRRVEHLPSDNLELVRRHFPYAGPFSDSRNLHELSETAKTHFKPIFGDGVNETCTRLLGNRAGPVGPISKD